MRINFYREFKNTVQNNAEKIAVYDGERSISFGDLNLIETKYASALFNVSKQAYDKPVGVFLPKCIESIAADLAIIHTGNIYMNLDVKYPVERLRNIFNVIQPVCIITNQKYAGILNEVDSNMPLLIVDADLDKADNSVLSILEDRLLKRIDTDLLCIINTSGSTGTPKGVALTHRGFFDYVNCTSATWNLTDSEIIGSMAPIGFDHFSFELCMLMSKAATLVCIPDQYNMFPVKILNLLNDKQATFIFWVPTIMVNIANMGLLDKIKMPTIKHIWFAGEVFPTKQFNIWYRSFPKTVQFVNLYGPCEITVDCTWYEVTHEMDESKPIPIGKQCQNVNVLILGENNKLVEKNQEGEICVRGTGLAMGYYNNPEKTATAFVQNPLNTSYPELIYRTGDIGLYNDDGDIIFKGRKDTLIKHSGYRIELSEIEHVIMNKLKLVKNACVVYNFSKKEITLIYENDSELEISEMRKEISKELPKYMIPTVYIYMKELPRGGTGKIDRALLNKQVNGK